MHENRKNEKCRVDGSGVGFLRGIMGAVLCPVSEPMADIDHKRMHQLYCTQYLLLRHLWPEVDVQGKHCPNQENPAEKKCVKNLPKKPVYIRFRDFLLV